MWYDLASGDSYFRQGDLGRALKKFLAVEKHYADISEDQFDFHSYCLRKMTLRSYVDMLKFQDRLHSFPYFHKAAIRAIRCYLKLHDSPKSTAGEDEMSKLAPAQKKKIKKQKKAEARAKKEAESKSEESTASGASKSGKRNVKPVDPDPHGQKLIQVEEPMAEASKYLRLLQKHSPNSLETHLLSFEVNMRKQKFLLAFQAVKQLLKLGAENPDSHRSLVKFFLMTESISAPTTEAEKLRWRVLEAERPSISQLQNKSLMEANKEFLGRHEDSLVHRAAYAEMLYILDPSKKTEAIKIIEDSTNKVVQTNEALGQAREWKLKDCIAVHTLLDTVLLDSQAASRWKSRCAEYFPCSTHFEGKHCSLMPDSVYNSSRKSNENGDTPNHPMGQTELSDGQLEAFKSLSVAT
jgi:peptide alpha-N-acetyltransferase